jgi:pantothenate kinase type III
VRILFDQGTPVPLRSHLSSHQVVTAFELHWSTLTNGDLLLQAEAAGFDLLVTTDQNLRYQQNLAARRIAVVVISSTSWPRIQKGIANVVDAITSVRPGVYIEVTVP